MKFEITNINDYYILKLNGRIVDYYTTVEAAGMAIESVKCQLSHETTPRVYELDLECGTLTEVV